jgi:Carboxypeptidase regulatory-like domain/TonB-dependent Receptor Plug Domain
MTTTRGAAFAFCVLAIPVSRFLVAQDPAARPPTQPTAYQVTGVVKDSSGAPVPEADVAVIESGAVRRQVATDAAGHFEFRDVPAGSIAIRVRRLGYRPSTVDVVVGATASPTSLEIIVTPAPAQLEEVRVNPNPVGRLREFYDHRQQRRSFARFLELADIRRIAPTSPSELFRTVPGITIRAATTGGNTIRIRGCQPTVWVDGQRIPGAELDEVVQPSDIGGIEFYSSSAGIPPQYMDPSNRLCGLILVWTRSQ